MRRTFLSLHIYAYTEIQMKESFMIIHFNIRKSTQFISIFVIIIIIIVVVVWGNECDRFKGSGGGLVKTIRYYICQYQSDNTCSMDLDSGSSKKNSCRIRDTMIPKNSSCNDHMLNEDP